MSGAVETMALVSHIHSNLNILSKLYLCLFRTLLQDLSFLSQLRYLSLRTLNNVPEFLFTSFFFSRISKERPKREK